MRQQYSPSTPNRRWIARKLLLSAFFVFSFIAYAIHKPLADPGNRLSQLSPAQIQASQTVPPAIAGASSAAAGANSTGPNSDPSATSPLGSPTQPATNPAPSAAASSQPAPTATVPAAPTAVAQGQYKNGTYTGSSVNVLVGIMQVQAVIQNGKLSSVQILQYPNDRQTSVRINQIAIPYLQQEAVQAQSANVNMISGATLTSQGFIYSLQAALSQAQN